jgi:hypothetical protein
MPRTRHPLHPALSAAMIAGAVALAPATAAAQPQGSDAWRSGQRDRVESYDPMDSYDMYLRDLRQRAQGQQRQGSMERAAREQFERGYRAGREDARRQRAAQGSGSESSMTPSGSGGRGSERYVVVPNVLPDSPEYRGLQDFALMPDYSRSMDWLLTAAQSLREAVQAMAQQPPTDRRNEAMSRARDALLETQQAMMQLPPDLRTR